MKPVALLIPALLVTAQLPPFYELVSLFDYDRSKPAHEQLTLRDEQAGVRIYRYSFDSPVAGRVPGLLILPPDKGRWPLILYGHWMMKGSPLRNKDEFLDEAVVMAHAGAASLCLDSPLVRDGETEDPDPMHGQGSNGARQMGQEWRRALDLLLVRSDLDPQRVAFVGHSFNAAVGAKLTAVEKRIGSFVLMANQYSLRDLINDQQNPEMVALRRRLGQAWIDTYFRKFPWDDSLPFVQHSAPAAVFLQNGRKDEQIPERVVRKSFAQFREPKRLEFYDAGHALNAAARLDRAEWLQRRLDLRAVDRERLQRIPDLR